MVGSVSPGGRQADVVVAVVVYGWTAVVVVVVVRAVVGLAGVELDVVAGVDAAAVRCAGELQEAPTRTRTASTDAWAARRSLMEGRMANSRPTPDAHSAPMRRG